MASRLLVGIDIGGTKTAAALSLEPPRILSRLVFPTEPQNGPEAAIERIINDVRSLLSSNGFQQSDIGAIGISCGGPLDPTMGVIQSPPNLPTWKDVPVCRILRSEFKTSCYLENDANAGALAEFRFGAGRGTKHLVFLTMGTGLGAGLILDGELQRGASHAAGEIGHVRLTRSGPRGHDKAGSAEGWASGGGMAQVAMRHLSMALARGERSLLEAKTGGIPDAITAREVAEAARVGDVVANAIVRQVGEKLGEAMAILIDVINPECIVVGGLALRFGDDLLRPAREVVAKEALRGSADICRIVPAALGEKIGDVAALCVAIQGITHAGRAGQSPNTAEAANRKTKKENIVETEIA